MLRAFDLSASKKIKTDCIELWSFFQKVLLTHELKLSQIYGQEDFGTWNIWELKFSALKNEAVTCILTETYPFLPSYDRDFPSLSLNASQLISGFWRPHCTLQEVIAFNFHDFLVHWAITSRCVQRADQEGGFLIKLQNCIANVSSITASITE